MKHMSKLEGHTATAKRAYRQLASAGKWPYDQLMLARGNIDVRIMTTVHCSRRSLKFKVTAVRYFP